MSDRAVQIVDDSTVAELEEYLQQRRFTAFARRVRQLQQTCGEQKPLLRLMADYFILTGNTASAIQMLIRWAGLDRSDPEPLLRLAEVFSGTGQVDQAFESLQLAREAGAPADEVVACRACVLIENGRFDEAAAVCEGAIADAEGQERTAGGLLRSLRRFADNLRKLQDLAELRAGLRQIASWVWRLRQQQQPLQAEIGERRLKLAAEAAIRAVKGLNCSVVIGGADYLPVIPHALEAQKSLLHGRRVVIYFCEQDVDAFLRAMSKGEWWRLLAVDGVEWFVGADASARLPERLATEIARPLVRVTVTEDASIQDAVERATNQIVADREQWFRQAERYYASLGRGHWADVLGPAPSRPPRVMLITTRFSTFLRYATRDLAAAFRRLGWETLVLQESDRFGQVTGLLVARSVAQFRPDLIWQINYLRSNWPGAVPDGVPFVCWDQDGMLHLLDRDQAASVGRFDFLACQGSGVGYIKNFGYPAEQLLYLPMCVDRSIFRPCESLGQPQVDVCYVSHHGWSVPQRIDLMLQDLPEDAREAVRPVLQEYAARLDEQFRRTGYPVRYDVSEEVLHEICRSRGIRIEPDDMRRLHDYAYRVLANAVWRQQAVRWVIEAGFGLRLYGAGWTENPEFRDYAAGEVEHGEPLRQVLCSSRAALQAVLAGNDHQRFWEAASCGAVVLMRYHPGDELYTNLRTHLERLRASVGQPIDQVITPAMRSSPAGRYVYEFLRRGLAGSDGILTEEVLCCVERAASLPSLRDQLGEAYEHLCFRDAGQLKERLRRLIADERHYAWLRERLLAAAEQRSYDAMLPRVISQIRARLLA